MIFYVRRYGQEVWEAFTSVFDCLPVAAVINQSIFCVHGGISPKLLDVQQLRDMKRPMSVEQVP